MKNKILVLLLGLVALSQGIAYAIPEPSDIGHKNLVTGQKQHEPYKEYQLVRLGGGVGTATVASRDVVIWDVVSDDGVTVSRTTVSFDGAIAGIMVTDLESADMQTLSARDDVGHRNYGWAQTYGPAQATIGAGAINVVVAGDAFYTSGDAGAITGYTTSTAIESTAASQGHVNRAMRARRGGFFLDNPAATDTQAQVFVDIQ